MSKVYDGMPASEQQLTDYKVTAYHPKTGRRIKIKVRALYYKIEEGSLVFRVYVPNSYPLPVHRFAAGHWAEVEVVLP